MSKDTGGPGPLDLLYAQHDRPLESGKAVLEKSVRRTEQAMSHAVELAKKCGMAVSAIGNGYWDNKAQIEAFYHAARAEALMEVLDEWHKPYEYNTGTFIQRLRAMADRDTASENPAPDNS